MLGLWHCYSWFISPTNLAASDNHCYMITEEQVVNCRQLVRPTVTHAVVISTACSAFSRRSDHKQVVPSSPEWARWPVKKTVASSLGWAKIARRLHVIKHYEASGGVLVDAETIGAHLTTTGSSFPQYEVVKWRASCMGQLWMLVIPPLWRGFR